MTAYIENAMEFSYAPGRRHFMEKLRTLFGAGNGTEWESKIGETDCKGKTDWKHWREKANEWWW